VYQILKSLVKSKNEMALQLYLLLTQYLTTHGLFLKSVRKTSFSSAFFPSQMSHKKVKRESCQSNLSTYFILPSKTSVPMEREGETKSDSSVAGCWFSTSAFVPMATDVATGKTNKIKRINNS